MQKINLIAKILLFVGYLLLVVPFNLEIIRNRAVSSTEKSIIEIVSRIESERGKAAINSLHDLKELSELSLELKLPNTSSAYLCIAPVTEESVIKIGKILEASLRAGLFRFEAPSSEGETFRFVLRSDGYFVDQKIAWEYAEREPKLQNFIALFLEYARSDAEPEDQECSSVFIDSDEGL